MVFVHSFLLANGWVLVRETNQIVDDDVDDDDESQEENPFKDFENLVQQVTRTFFFFLLLTQLSF